MDFLNTLKHKPFMLYDGPMETRIEYGAPIKLDKEMSIFALLYNAKGRDALKSLYEQDSQIAIQYHSPIILNAPTFRASRSHCQRLGYTDPDAIEKINLDAVNFIKDIREQFSKQTDEIFVTAPMGPKLAGYSPDNSFTIDEAIQYHTPQANALKKAVVDIISIAAMPGLIETIGCAKAVSRTGLPYSVGFIINHDGMLLDGHSPKELIMEIDKNIFPQPNFYIISCTHPTVAANMLKENEDCYRRILGIKANGSSRPGKELLKLDHPEADEPIIFADELIALGAEYHFKIYGGCCGTDGRHLKALAKILSEKYAAKSK